MSKPEHERTVADLKALASECRTEADRDDLASMEGSVAASDAAKLVASAGPEQRVVFPQDDPDAVLVAGEHGVTTDRDGRRVTTPSQQTFTRAEVVGLLAAFGH